MTEVDPAVIKNGRIFVVLNPVAGDGTGAEVEEQLPDYWQSLNYTVYETSEDDVLADVEDHYWRREARLGTWKRRKAPRWGLYPVN